MDVSNLILVGPFLYLGGKSVPVKYKVARVALMGLGAAAVLAAAFSAYSKKAAK